MGKHFTLITDNRAIQLLFASTTSKPPARIERMALRLSQFDYTIIHQPGASNIADYYSRHPSGGQGSDFLEEVRAEQYINAIVRDILPMALKLSEVIDATKEDKELSELIGHVRRNTYVRNLPKNLDGYKNVYGELNVIENGILLRGQRIIMPLCLRERVVELAHVGHQGMVKTKSLIRSRIWYPNIDAQVEKKLSMCRECQSNVVSK